MFYEIQTEIRLNIYANLKKIAAVYTFLQYLRKKRKFRDWIFAEN